MQAAIQASSGTQQSHVMLPLWPPGFRKQDSSEGLLNSTPGRAEPPAGCAGARLAFQGFRVLP